MRCSTTHSFLKFLPIALLALSACSSNPSVTIIPATEPPAVPSPTPSPSGSPNPAAATTSITAVYATLPNGQKNLSSQWFAVQNLGVINLAFNYTNFKTSTDAAGFDLSQATNSHLIVPTGEPHCAVTASGTIAASSDGSQPNPLSITLQGASCQPVLNEILSAPTLILLFDDVPTITGGIQIPTVSISIVQPG